MNDFKKNIEKITAVLSEIKGVELKLKEISFYLVPEWTITSNKDISLIVRFNAIERITTFIIFKGQATIPLFTFYINNKKLIKDISFELYPTKFDANSYVKLKPYIELGNWVGNRLKEEFSENSMRFIAEMEE